jgi:hypothetical protein
MKKIALVAACLGVAVPLVEVALGMTDSLRNVPPWLDAVLFCAWPTQFFLGGHLPSGPWGVVPLLASISVLYLLVLSANALLYVGVACTCTLVYRFVARLFTHPRPTI